MNAAVRLWQRVFKRPVTEPTDHIADDRTLFALATVIFLVQFPHVFHLPIWVSAAGAALVGLRLWLHRAPDNTVLSTLLSPVSVTFLAAATAVLIRFEYGYSLGRDPCVAFLFVLIAAKFAEIRRAADATLLLCLSGFLLLTQYFYSQTILAAVVTLPAVVALAFALSILRDANNPANNTHQIKLVCKLLVQGLPLAAVLFVLFPRLPGPLWSLPDDAVARTGLSESMAPGSIGSLSQSNEVAFRVEFDGTPPRTAQLYWRGPVLSEFDGREWTASEFNSQARPVFNTQTAHLSHYTVMLQPHRQRWLFALDAAASLPRRDTVKTAAANGPALGQMREDGQLIATSPVTQVLRYRQSSLLSDRFVSPVAPPASTLYLPGKNPKTIAFAKDLRRQSHSDRDYANRALTLFNRDTFRYTLQPQLLGDAPVDEFLFDSKAGFCEHYAAAFVVLMRAADIPARVVTGYLGGEMNGDYMIVRQSHAHAWAEAYIDGAWQRFDPTGFVAPERVEQSLSAALPDEVSAPGFTELDASWLRSAQLQWDALNHGWQSMVVNFNDSTQEKLWERLGFSNPSLMQIVVAVIALGAAWSLFILGLPQWRTAHLPPNERLWARMCRLLSANGLPRKKNETATEYLQRAAWQWPTQARQFEQLNRDFSRMRFQPTGDAEATEIRARTLIALRRLTVGLTLARFQRQPPRRDARKLTHDPVCNPPIVVRPQK